ncbi:MAG TPA: Crp/Fnr family transcriptional regulator [Actinomycetota bacterium]
MAGVQTSLPLFHLPSIWRARVQRVDGTAVREIDAGCVLVREGELPTSLSVIDAGAVAECSRALSGRVATLGILGPGDVVGIHALAGSCQAMPGATALVRSIVLCVPLQALQEAIRDDPILASGLCAKLAQHLSRGQRSLAEALTLSVPERVLGALHDLAARHGRRSGGGIKISIPLSQDVLAALIGATRESVNRALRDLKASGAIRTDGRTYVLPPSNGQVAELGRS